MLKRGKKEKTLRRREVPSSVQIAAHRNSGGAHQLTRHVGLQRSVVIGQVWQASLGHGGALHPVCVQGCEYVCNCDDDVMMRDDQASNWARRCASSPPPHSARHRQHGRTCCLPWVRAWRSGGCGAGPGDGPWQAPEPCLTASSFFRRRRSARACAC